MASSIDKLDSAISMQLSQGGNMANLSKDQFLDIVDGAIGSISNSMLFFNNLIAEEKKLKQFLDTHRREPNIKSIAILNSISGNLVSIAKRAMDERFLGAFVDTLNSYATILREIEKNVDELFTNKSISLFNTKISHVAVYGAIENAEIYSKFINGFIELFLSDFNKDLPKPAPYLIKFLNDNVKIIPDIINKMLNTKLSSTFVSGILKYKNGGSDVLVVNGENQSNAKFAKISGEVSESDIEAGTKGFKIFRLIGNLFVDRKDNKMRKLKAERDLMQARVQLLKLALEGVDPESPEYKQQVKIIENYQGIIARLDQKLDKYYN